MGYKTLSLSVFILSQEPQASQWMEQEAKRKGKVGRLLKETDKPPPPKYRKEKDLKLGDRWSF